MRVSVSMYPYLASALKFWETFELCGALASLQPDVDNNSVHINCPNQTNLHEPFEVLTVSRGNDILRMQCVHRELECCLGHRLYWLRL